MMPEDTTAEAQEEIGYQWHPIEDLQADWELLTHPELHAAASEWNQERALLKDETKIAEFGRRLATRWAIETGIIERLYDIDRGITETLIDLGLQATDKIHTSLLARNVVHIIKDHNEGLDFVFAFVKEERQLTTSYIKELHQLLLRHQERTEAVDHLGRKTSVEVVRGEWKRWPNNPLRPDGKVHQYCPPEQVQSEMERLTQLHDKHGENGVASELAAAWLHHRLTQIHPFQDGNGRIARALATLVFVKAGLLPLVVTRDHRDAYLQALAVADADDLKPLTDLIAAIQVDDLQKAIDFVRTLRGAGAASIIASAAERAATRERKSLEDMLSLTASLMEVTRTRLEEVALEVQRNFEQHDLQVDAGVTVSDEQSEWWWNRQIIQVAKKLEYYASLDRPRRWVRLRLKPHLPGGPITNIVFSFHHKDRLRGFMVATVFVGFARGDSDSPESAEGAPDVYAGCDDPFGYSVEHRQVESSYRTWMEKAVETALDQWQKSF